MRIGGGGLDLLLQGLGGLGVEGWAGGQLVQAGLLLVQALAQIGQLVGIDRGGGGDGGVVIRGWRVGLGRGGLGRGLGQGSNLLLQRLDARQKVVGQGRVRLGLSQFLTRGVAACGSGGVDHRLRIGVLRVTVCGNRGGLPGGGQVRQGIDGRGSAQTGGHDAAQGHGPEARLAHRRGGGPGGCAVRRGGAGRGRLCILGREGRGLGGGAACGGRGQPVGAVADQRRSGRADPSGLAGLGGGSGADRDMVDHADMGGNPTDLRSGIGGRARRGDGGIAGGGGAPGGGLWFLHVPVPVSCPNGSPLRLQKGPGRVGILRSLISAG